MSQAGQAALTGAWPAELAYSRDAPPRLALLDDPIQPKSIKATSITRPTELITIGAT